MAEITQGEDAEKYFTSQCWDAVTIDGGYLRAAGAVDLSGSDPVLRDEDGLDRYEGTVDGDVWFSAASSDRSRRPRARRRGGS